jgi:hypothetical protein
MSGFPAAGSGPVLITVASTWRQPAVQAGWSVADHRPLSSEPWALDGRVVVTDDPAEAASVLVRGGAAAPAAVGPGGVDADLVADARRIGATVWPETGDGPTDRSVPCEDDTDVLLAALITGSSVAAAARQANMSVRTAQRRLYALREKYRVATTAGVVASWSRDTRLRRQGLAT